jgi:hypothetical protein
MSRPPQLNGPHALLAAVLSLTVAATPATGWAQTGAGREPDGAGEGEDTDPAELLEVAQNWWYYGAFERVIEITRGLVAAESIGELTEEQRIQAYLLLGASEFLLNGPSASTEPFHELLRLDPDYALDPFLYPADMIRHLGDVADLYEAELEEIRRRRRADLGGEPGRLVFVERRVEERSLWVSMLPFGRGHISNGDYPWGLTYMGLEVGLGVASLALYLRNEGSRDADGFVPDLDRAERRQTAQIATGIAFFGVMAINVLHGALIHEGVIETSFGIVEDPESTPGYEGGGEGGASRLLPFAAPAAGAGTGAGWVFGFEGTW